MDPGQDPVANHVNTMCHQIAKPRVFNQLEVVSQEVAEDSVVGEGDNRSNIPHNTRSREVHHLQETIITITATTPGSRIDR